MAITGFKPVLGGLTLGTGGFSLSGDNAGFCHAILGKAAGSRPGQLESLTYLLPSQGQEAGGGEAQSPVVVNLLMQLRASYDQNNIFLRTGQASQAQIMERLRQTLARSDQAVRDQAGEIERAVRNSLFQEHEFRQALKRLERELKKNGDRPERAAALTQTGRETTALKPKSAIRAVGLSAWPGSWRIGTQPKGNGRAALPLPSPMGGGRRTQSRTEDQTAFRSRVWTKAKEQTAHPDRTPPGNAGQAMLQTAQWPAQGLRKEPPERLEEGDAREGVWPIAVALPTAETVPGKGTPPLIGLQPQGAEEPERAAPSRTRSLGHSPDVSAQGGTTPKRTGRGAGIHSEADGAEIKPPQGARAKRNPVERAGEEPGEQPSSMPDGPSHKAEAGAGVRVEAVRINGADRMELPPAPFALYPFRADLQVGVFPGFQVGKLPISLHLSSDWRAAKVFWGLFSRTPGVYQIIRPPAAHAAQGGPVLRWRRMASAPQGDTLPGARRVSEGAVPRAALPRAIVSLTGVPVHRTVAQNGGGEQVIHAARSQAVGDSGRAEAGSGAFGFEKAAEISHRAIAQLAQPIWHTVSPDISTATLLYTDRAASDFPPKPELAHPWAGVKAAASVFTQNAATRVLRRSAWVPAQAAVPDPAALSASALRTELVAVPARPGKSAPQAVFPSVPQNGRARQMSARMPGRDTPASLPRELDSQMGQEADFKQNRWEDLLPALRSAAAPILRGALTWGRHKGPERWKLTESTTSAQFTPHILRQIPAWAGEREPRPQGTPLHRAKIPNRGQNAPVRNAGGALPAGIFRHTVWLGTAPVRNSRTQTAAWTPRTGTGPAGIELEGVPTGKGLAAVWPGTAPVRNSRTQAAGWTPRAGTGPVGIELADAPIGKGFAAVWPGTAPVRNSWTQTAGWTPRAGTGPIGIELADAPTGKGFAAAWPRTALARNSQAQTAAGKPKAGIGPSGQTALPLLTHFALPLEPLEDTLSGPPSDKEGKTTPQRGGPAMIFRSPAPAAAQGSAPQEQEGEAVLAAQAIPPEQVRAMNRAFSYASPVNPENSAEAAPDTLFEQRVRTDGQGEQAVNYNRLTEEIMVRIERRLRAERRKFGL